MTTAPNGLQVLFFLEKLYTQMVSFYFSLIVLSWMMEETCSFPMLKVYFAKREKKSWDMPYRVIYIHVCFS